MDDHRGYREVLSFWFEQIEQKSWWSAQAEFDARVRSRFGDTLRRAARGECFAWRFEPAGRLAEIIVLDQFSRNIHRGTPLAFAQDPMALTLAQWAVAEGAHLKLDASQRSFMLMPFMHSESAVVHKLAQVLFREHTPKNNIDFELRHKAIIDRFGRYPHRNEVLGRPSTPEEVEFLSQPGSSF
ncbi:MAG: DUF924 family protein [Rudaea sp.]